MLYRIVQRKYENGNLYYNAQYVDPDTGLWEAVAQYYTHSIISNFTPTKFSSIKEAKKALRKKKLELKNSRDWDDVIDCAQM